MNAPKTSEFPDRVKRRDAQFLEARGEAPQVHAAHIVDGDLATTRCGKFLTLYTRVDQTDPAPVTCKRCRAGALRSTVRKWTVRAKVTAEKNVTVTGKTRSEALRNFKAGSWVGSSDYTNTIVRRIGAAVKEP